MIKNFTYQNPTKLIFGKDKVKTLAKEIAKYGDKVLLVYGGGSIKKNGIYNQVIEELQGFEIFEISGVEPNPRVSTARAAAKLIKENGIDFILAIGGGSTIDCTKLISVAAFYDGDAWDIVLGKHKPKKALPFGTILTLSATGSEMNSGSVITNFDTKEKLGWSSNLVYPKFSILDPSYTFTVPKNQTVNGIVDTMSHLLEQYFNKEHNPLLDTFIAGTMKTVMSYAPLVLEKPNDYEARSVLMLSATVALNHSLSWGTVTDWGTHRIEHAVSAIFDIAHGAGLAIIMPNWLLHILERDVDRVKAFAVNIMDVDIVGKSDTEIAEEGIFKLQNFWKSIGAPTKLSDVGIKKEDLEKITNLAAETEIGYSYPLNKEEIYKILESAL